MQELVVVGLQAVLFHRLEGLRTGGYAEAEDLGVEEMGFSDIALVDFADF